MECKVFPEKIYVTSSFISISIYIYKQTGNLQINDLFKTSGKNTIRIEGEGGRGVFSEAKPQAGNSEQIPREEQGRCLGALPGTLCPPREGSRRHLQGSPPRPPARQPLLPLSLFSSITSSPPPRGPLYPSPQTLFLPQHTSSARPASNSRFSSFFASPRGSHPPGLSAAPCWPRCSRFPWSGAPSPQGSRSGGRPYSLLRPLLQPRHRRGAKPRLIRPQRTSALRSPLPHHPLLAPAPRSPSPRAETESRQRPPAPAMAPPPAAGSTAPALPPLTATGTASPSGQSAVRAADTRARWLLGLLGYVVRRTFPGLGPKRAGSRAVNIAVLGQGSRERWEGAGVHVVVLGMAGWGAVCVRTALSSPSSFLSCAPSSSPRPSGSHGAVAKGKGQERDNSGGFAPPSAPFCSPRLHLQSWPRTLRAEPLPHLRVPTGSRSRDGEGGEAEEKGVSALHCKGPREVGHGRGQEQPLWGESQQAEVWHPGEEDQKRCGAAGCLTVQGHQEGKRTCKAGRKNGACWCGRW